MTTIRCAGEYAARDAPTVAIVAARFLEEYVEARRKPATERLYRLAIDGHIGPLWGALPVAEVETSDVVRLHHRLRATPYMANRVLAVLLETSEAGPSRPAIARRARTRVGAWRSIAKNPADATFGLRVSSGSAPRCVWVSGAARCRHRP